MAEDDWATPPVGAGELPPEAFRLIVDRTAHAIVVIDQAGLIIYAGGSIHDVVGWRAEDIVGHNMSEFLPPDQIPVAVGVLAELQETNRMGVGVPMVFELLRPDGTTSWAEIGAMPLLDVPGMDAIALRLRRWDAQHQVDEFVSALLADEPLPQVLGSLAHAIALLLETDGATVHHGFDGTAFADVVAAGLPVACVTVDRGPWCETVITGESVVCSVDALPSGAAEAARSAGIEGLWTALVPSSEGLAPAVVTVWRSEPGPPLTGHRKALESAARYVQLALVRTAEHQQLRHLAGHDALTGVANRNQFRDRLAQALAIGERDLAVAFCDLDGFKAVNDTFGHSAGDVALVEVARRLREALRVGDEIARMGGDEFTVLFRNVPDAGTARHVVERLSAAVAEPFPVGEGEVSLGISVGVALAEPDATADELLSRADQALYAVKRAGGGAARVWASPT